MFNILIDIHVPLSFSFQILYQETKIDVLRSNISIFQSYIKIKRYQHRIKGYSNFISIVKKMQEDYVEPQPIRTTIQTEELLAQRKLSKIPKKKKKRYNIIPYEKRVELLDLILNQKETIKASASKLGIKLCTAKHILYLYKNEGKIHQRKQDQECSDSQWSQPRQYRKVGSEKKQLSQNLGQSPFLSNTEQSLQNIQSTPKQNKKDIEQQKILEKTGQKTDIGIDTQKQIQKKQNKVEICYVPVPIPIFNFMGQTSLESLLASWPWNFNMLNDSVNI